MEEKRQAHLAWIRDVLKEPMYAAVRYYLFIYLFFPPYLF